MFYLQSLYKNPFVFVIFVFLVGRLLANSSSESVQAIGVLSPYVFMLSFISPEQNRFWVFFAIVWTTLFDFTNQISMGYSASILVLCQFIMVFLSNYMSQDGFIGKYVAYSISIIFSLLIITSLAYLMNLNFPNLALSMIYYVLLFPLFHIVSNIMGFLRYR